MTKFNINPKKFSINESSSSDNINILENIIKKVNPGEIRIDEDSEELITVDNKTGEPKRQNGFTIIRDSFMGRTYSHYVANWSSFSRINDLICEISDPETGMIIELKMSFELSCMESRGEDVILFFQNNLDKSRAILKRTISSWIRSFVIDHPNFISEFASFEKVLNREIVDKSSKNIGLSLVNMITSPFIVDEGENDSPPEHITIVHSTPCEIRDNTIEVKNKIVLNLKNRRIFSLKNIKNPEEWIKQKVDAIIQNELIKKTFRDVVDEFKSRYKKGISKELEKVVREIGYSVEHIISIPSEEIEEFLNGFTFTIGEEDTFETSQASIKVRLNVTVEGKGTKLNGIDKKYIKPKKSIIDEVEKMTRETISTQMRKVTPLRYYSKTKEVFSTIKEKITLNVFKNFKLDQNDFSVSISLLDTDIKERFDLLRAERGRIIINSKDNVACYEVKFRVRDVSNWISFHKNHIKYYGNTILEYKDIANYIKSNIELDFKINNSSSLKEKNARDIDFYITKLYQNTQVSITEEFGILLGNPHLTRILVCNGDADNSIIIALTRKRKELTEQLVEAIVSGDEEYKEELNLSIEKINESIQVNLQNSLELPLSQSDDSVKSIEYYEEE
ncbi:hypothetical protein [uncultured Kordia sp.]|uniref:hypothetical protein n=1 Tax=uncultured Kordia sp. TaxID=507699 RepID=UPI002610551B|nr:hypothetical protein [uncultured Kordia sp.]